MTVTLTECEQAQVDAIRAALHNWVRYSTRDAIPDLDVGGPPWAQYWRASGADRDYGWGDPAPPESLPEPVNEQDALDLDRRILLLPDQHRTVIVRHFIYGKPYHQDRITIACLMLANCCRTCCAP